MSSDDVLDYEVLKELKSEYTSGSSDSDVPEDLVDQRKKELLLDIKRTQKFLAVQDGLVTTGLSSAYALAAKGSLGIAAFITFIDLSAIFLSVPFGRRLLQAQKEYRELERLEHQ